MDVFLVNLNGEGCIFGYIDVFTYLDVSWYIVPVFLCVDISADRCFVFSASSGFHLADANE